MYTVKKKIKPPKNRSTKKRLTKGAVNAGTIFVLFILFIVGGGSSLMVGNFLPNETKNIGQEVIIISETPENAKNNLQLYTFPGATYTPTPSPTPTPEPTDRPTSGGGDGGGSGDGDGGNNSPKSGSGGGGGGGSSGGTAR